MLTYILSFSSSMTVTSFAELARTVAANWKSADKETKDYCVEVVRILKKRHTLLTKVGGIGCLSMIDSIGPGPREEAKPRNAGSEASDTGLAELGAIFCLPEELDSVSTGPKNDTERINAQLPVTSTNAFGDRLSQQYHGMHASLGNFPVVHGQNNMNSRDGSRTWLMDKIYQYHHDQAALILNAIDIWGDDSLNHTTINMPQPVPLGVIQETNLTASLPIMTGNTVSQTGTDQQDVQHQFHAIMNASRRASISNVMTLPGSAMSQTGTYHRDVQQQFHAIMNANRRASISNVMTSPGSAMSQTGTDHQDVQQQFHAIMDGSRRAPISNMMTLPGRAPMPYGIRGFGQQPSPINRWYSPPECQNPSEFDTSRAIYDIQELDVADSNILGMWGSSKVQEKDEF